MSDSQGRAVVLTAKAPASPDLCIPGGVSRMGVQEAEVVAEALWEALGFALC